MRASPPQPPNDHQPDDWPETLAELTASGSCTAFCAAIESAYGSIRNAFNYIFKSIAALYPGSPRTVSASLSDAVWDAFQDVVCRDAAWSRSFANRLGPRPSTETFKKRFCYAVKDRYRTNFRSEASR